MKFRTELIPKSSEFQIDLNTRILTIGSCFADVIGNELQANKLNVFVNPFGTVFNPVSISKQLECASSNQLPESKLYLQNQDVHLHYDFHSSFWSNSREELEERLKNKISEVNQFITHTDILIITLGTAFVYRHLATNKIVTNCHKTPSQAFKKELLEIKNIVEILATLIFKLKTQNSKLKTILTLSPVRHTKDGLEDNQLSKALLRVACHELVATFENVHYFPAYELMMDDLRDYRFYKPDLIHPNEMAEKYIFEKFVETYFSEPLKSFINEWKPLRNALNHTVLQQGTAAHQQFLEDLLRKLRVIGKTVNVNNEIMDIEKRMV
jgi:hypothetical protein